MSAPTSSGQSQNQSQKENNKNLVYTQKDGFRKKFTGGNINLS